MRARCGFFGVLLALLVGACGRFGVELLQSDELPRLGPDSAGDVPDAGTDAGDRQDAGGDELDAGRVDSGLSPNSPVVGDGGGGVDAGLAPTVPVDAATVADASDGSTGSEAGASDAGVVDAGATGAPGDAGADAGTDAGTDGGSSPCAGQSVFGLCWYLAAANSSCNAACSAHGGFDTGGTSYFGTLSEGGSLAECTQILTALAGPGSPVAEGVRADNVTFGCHVWNDNSRWWLSSGPAFDPNTAGGSLRITCSCRR